MQRTSEVVRASVKEEFEVDLKVKQHPNISTAIYRTGPCHDSGQHRLDHEASEKAVPSLRLLSYDSPQADEVWFQTREVACTMGTSRYSRIEDSSS